MSDRDVHRLGPLLERSRCGEAQARNALLGRLRPYLQVLIRSWLGSDLARQLADSDVVQETLLRIDQGFDAFRGQSVPELLGWVRRIAFHAAIDRKRKAGLPVRPDDLLEAVAAREPSPLQELERAEEVFRLAQALEQLSGPRREVVQLRLFEGLSYAEISRRMGGTEGALRVLFARAIEQLRQLMGNEP